MRKNSITATGLLVVSCLAFAMPVHADEVNTAEGTAIGNFNYNIGSSDHPPAYAPGIITAPIAPPTLFSIQGVPAQIKGLPMLSNHFFSTVHYAVANGKSRSTKIIFNRANIEKKRKNKARKIKFSFSGVADGELIGSITIQGKKNKSDQVDMPTIVYDTTHYIDDVDELQGYNISLLSIPNAITYTMGVDTRATGVALSPYVSGFMNGPAGALTGLIGGVSKSGGVTVPTASLGCTFLVLIDGKNQQRVDIRKNYNMPEIEESATENGNNKKKYEAIKENPPE